METPIHNRLGLSEEQVKVLREELASGVPVKRVGTAEEMAKGYLFLASEDSSFVLGAEIVMDGGWAQLWSDCFINTLVKKDKPLTNLQVTAYNCNRKNVGSRKELVREESFSLVEKTQFTGNHDCGYITGETVSCKPEKILVQFSVASKPS